MTNLFIDTNIFLGFYLLSSDDLEELRKLGALIRTEKVALLLPQQVVDEFNRNRDNQIAHGLKILKEEKLNNQFPQFCKEYDEYSQMKIAIKKYDEAKKALMAKLLEDIEHNRLKADNIINELFALAKIIQITPDIYNDAVVRFNIGNPPGKDRSYGDAINWTAVLKTAAFGDDIHIITDDADYASSTDPSKLKPFLSKEWQSENFGSAVLYKRLSEYFSANFKDIKLADEYEKEHLIKALAESANFRTTHATIWDLDKFATFTKSQAEELIQAAITNNQIKWIAEDDDVASFFYQVFSANKDLIEEDVAREFTKIYLKENNQQHPSG